MFSVFEVKCLKMILQPSLFQGNAIYVRNVYVLCNMYICTVHLHIHKGMKTNQLALDKWQKKKIFNEEQSGFE